MGRQRDGAYLGPATGHIQPNALAKRLNVKAGRLLKDFAA